MSAVEFQLKASSVEYPLQRCCVSRDLKDEDPSNYRSGKEHSNKGAQVQKP